MKTRRTNLVSETFAINNRYSEIMGSCAKLSSDKFKSWCKEDSYMETLRHIAIVAMEAYMEALGERAYEMENELTKRVKY